MDEDTLNKLELEINALRARTGNIKQGELESLAKKLGRERSKRGAEPTYVLRQLPNRFPLSIPGHRQIAKFTAKSILNTLEDDVDAWRQWLLDH
jgi:hypothetical protein